MRARMGRGLLSLGLVATFLVGGASAASAAPANDDFADRITLSGIAGQINGSNLGATFEPGEPFTGGDTVWYDWTTLVGGHATVRTCVADFDTTLAVYTGDTLAALVLVGSNDDHCGSGSVVQWTATAGTNYKIQVDGASGAEGNFTLSFSQCTIDGTSGDDNIVGTKGNDVICAGPGNDSISALRGNDWILGQDGNDTTLSGGGDDVVDGGPGTDTAGYYEAAVTGPGSIHLGEGWAFYPGGGKDTLISVENAKGSPFDDSITGSAGPNYIQAREGNDTVNGKGGDDFIEGKAGDDTLTGENGNDTLVGGPDDDALFGNDGDDKVNGVDGVAANDTVNGGSGVDTCTADAGDAVAECP